MCSSYVSSVKEVFKLEDITKAKNNGTHSIRWTTKKEQPSGIIAKLQWIWYCKLRCPALKVFTVILALLSLVVLWCECIFSINKPVMSIFALMISPEEVSSSDVNLTLTIFIPLLYIIVCSYWSLFQLRIFRYYRLVPNQNSDCNSLLFSAAYLSRIAPPLALNFIHVLKLKGTTFQKVMSSMEKIPIIGDALFNEYAPIALVVVCAFFLFDVVGKVMKCCKVSWFYYEDSEQSEKGVEDGKAIIEAERKIWSNGTRADTAASDFVADIEADSSASVPEEDFGKKRSKFFRLFSSKKPERLEQASLSPYHSGDYAPTSSASQSPHSSSSSSSSTTPNTSADTVKVVPKKYPKITKEDILRKSKKYEQLEVETDDYTIDDIQPPVVEPKPLRGSGWKQLSPATTPSAPSDNANKGQKKGWRKLN